MLEKEINQLLEETGELHLAEGIETLSELQRHSFLEQLKQLSPALLLEQRSLLNRPALPKDFRRLNHYEIVENPLAKDKPLSRKMGCLVLAGGLGSRLGSTAPKALFPITIQRRQTLLGRVCEKTKAASDKCSFALPLCIMTSKYTHAPIEAYLKEHQFFGLQQTQVSLILQNNLPFLADEGHWILEKPGIIAEGPDGNGEALNLFKKSPIYSNWRSQGIETLNIIPIDNPLADPFDPVLYDLHTSSGAEISLKTIFRLDPEEKVGIVGMENGKVAVCEYSELPSHSSEFSIANITLFCIELSFLDKITPYSLPFHLARKKAPIFSKKTGSELKEIWKFEKFIFDVFPHAAHVKVCVFPRDEVYAPLKNSRGKNSPEEVQKALLDYDRKVFTYLTGKEPPRESFELDPSFYYAEKPRNF